MHYLKKFLNLKCTIERPNSYDHMTIHNMGQFVLIEKNYILTFLLAL